MLLVFKVLLLVQRHPLIRAGDGGHPENELLGKRINYYFYNYYYNYCRLYLKLAMETNIEEITFSKQDLTVLVWDGA